MITLTFEEGYEAFINGFAIHENPYKLIPNQGLEWSQGWFQAQKDLINNKLSLE